MKARKKGALPKHADKDYGCPRGKFCDFAHGEQELMDQDGRIAPVNKQKRVSEKLKRKREQEMKDYFTEVNRRRGDMKSFILQGTCSVLSFVMKFDLR